MNKAVYNTRNYYDLMRYRDVVREGFYDFQAIKENYRINCGAEGLRRDLVLK
jgi:leucyl-tRNA synthetase